MLLIALINLIIILAPVIHFYIYKGRMWRFCKKLLNFTVCFFFQRKDYVKYAKVFPLSGILEFKVPSKWYRRIVGILEITCGLALAVVPSSRCKELIIRSHQAMIFSLYNRLLFFYTLFFSLSFSFIFLHISIPRSSTLFHMKIFFCRTQIFQSANIYLVIRRTLNSV